MAGTNGKSDVAADDLPGRPKPRNRGLQKLPKVPKSMKKTRKGRLSDWELHERRVKVMRLRLRGLTYQNIAKLLGMGIETVRRDLEAIAKENAARIDAFEQNRYIGESLVVYDEVLERAWGEYSAAKEGSQTRLRSLDLVRTTQNDKLKALQECGLIQKEPQKMEVAHSFKLEWNEDMQNNVAKALLQQSLHTQLPDPSPEGVIDVEAKEEAEDSEKENA